MLSQIRKYLTKGNVFFAIILLLMTTIACDKRISNYGDIVLDNFKGEIVTITSLEGKFLVFTFLSPECPLSENYTRTLNNLQSEYSGEDFQFYYIFPGTFYHRQQIEQFAKIYHLKTESIYFDPQYVMRDYCQATITPEVFLIDQLGKIEYQGAIDNWAITLGKQRQVVTEHYLRDAIDEVDDNKKVSISNTRAVGCIIE